VSALADGTVITMSLVGDRDYIRGLDLVKHLDVSPGDILDIRFLRPLASDVMLSRLRPERPVAALIHQRQEQRQTFYVSNLSQRVTRIPDARSRGMFCVLRLRRFIALVRYRSADHWADVDALFGHFQSVFSRRFHLTRLTLRVLPKGALGLTTAYPAIGTDGQPVGCRVRFNGQDWCSMRIAPRHGP
jgi:hypothetical protein